MAMIRLLIALECVLLLIVGIDRGFIDPRSGDKRAAETGAAEAPTTLEVAERPTPPTSVVNLGNAASMTAAIVPSAAAAGAGSPSGEAPEEVLATALAAPQRAPITPDLAGFREVDRLAIARELLGLWTAPADAAGAESSNQPAAETDTTEADRPGFAPAPRPRLPKAAAGADVAVAAERPPARPGHVPPRFVDSAVRPSSTTVLALAAPVERPGTAQEGTARVAAAQELLGRLGYSPGAADGVLGERTEAALRSYQSRAGLRPDGRVGDALLAQLRRDVRAQISGARMRERKLAAITPATPPDKPSEGWLTSVVSGFQRMLGHRFDGVARPQELRAYCRSNTDTWVFDEGRRDFVYCGRIVADNKG
jgi:Putative peptidoglycan binding domain